MRKVTANLVISMLLYLDDDTDIYDVIDNMKMDFVETTGKADIIDFCLDHTEIVDSK